MTTDARHTPEPWRMGGDEERFLVYGADDRPVMTKKRPADNQRPDAERHANVLRCIAAVNFCRGTPTAALADGGLTEFVEVARRCLESFDRATIFDSDGSPFHELRAALARLKGE